MGRWPSWGSGRRGAALGAIACAVAVLGGCGSSPQSDSGGSSGGARLTLQQAEANLKAAGYRITVFSPHEGVLQIDGTHTASGGFSIDFSPHGDQLYAAVYETNSPGVRAAIVSHNSDETRPIVRGSLIFTISGSAAALRRIVGEAGAPG
jgi:hypothetical protein